MSLQRRSFLGAAIVIPFLSVGVARFFAGRTVTAQPSSPPDPKLLDSKPSDANVGGTELPRITDDMVVQIEAVVDDVPYWTGRAKNFSLQITPDDGVPKLPIITKDNVGDLPIEDFSLDGVRINKNSHYSIVTRFDEIHVPNTNSEATYGFKEAPYAKKWFIVTVGDVRLRLFGEVVIINVAEHHMNAEGGNLMRKAMIRTESARRER